MQYRSRLKNKVTNTLYKNTALSIVLIIIVLLAVVFFGLQLLINLSLFLGKVKSINEISTSSENEFVLAPKLNPITEATNSAILEVSGIGSQPGQTIELFLNDDYQAKTVVDNDLAFVLSDIHLNSGENRIKTQAKISDKESPFSQEIIVIYETTPPALELQEPFDGQVIQKTPRVKIVGKAEPDSTVLINTFLPIVDSNGNFTYTLPLNAGENSIKVTAKDKAGNQTVQEIKVIFEP